MQDYRKVLLWDSQLHISWMARSCLGVGGDTSSRSLFFAGRGGGIGLLWVVSDWKRRRPWERYSEFSGDRPRKDKQPCAGCFFLREEQVYSSSSGEEEGLFLCSNAFSSVTKRLEERSSPHRLKKTASCLRVGLWIIRRSSILNCTPLLVQLAELRMRVLRSIQQALQCRNPSQTPS